MLTHYHVTLRGEPTCVVGRGQLHRDGVLVPHRPLIRDFPVEVFPIQRGTKRPNAAARRACQRAINRTWHVAEQLRHPNMLDESPSVRRVMEASITHRDLFHIQGVRATNPS